MEKELRKYTFEIIERKCYQYEVIAETKDKAIDKFVDRYSRYDIEPSLIEEIDNTDWQIVDEEIVKDSGLYLLPRIPIKEEV
jgi:hypothetical protein